MAILPKKNELGFYEIRLESIGGLGANLAGKMLAEAGVIGHGLNGTNFSSYGSEKKGSPVKSFIRFSEPNVEIHDHSPVLEPHVIGIFHEGLYKTVDVVRGLRKDGIVLVNSTRSFEEVKADLHLTHGTLAIVDALGISVEEQTRVNTAMLGALIRVIDFLDPNYIVETLKRTFGKKYPELVDANIRTFNRGYVEVKIFEITPDEQEPVRTVNRIESSLGYETQEIGGLISARANSIQKDMSSSRLGFIPKLDLEKCIHCGQCDAVCPDFCFVAKEGTDKRGRPQMFLQGIDYQYCKGCLKCVSVCPTNALTKVRETKYFAEQNRIPHQFPYYGEEVY
ncbi:2-oxoacid:acceptor oxidoreductase family protein [Fervidibacillus albus]|uniref:2-oxoacid:acceptor oxidoreductase family protein n=1 Tax=Fervidibacillus albus TaxID=2980026 RepID=A0A9E8RYM4_9BACI|nr:2-oxoacid:acceptor oxidoreductase family protein [Fervidibacillus albus]WAA10787.1 2-oxoacid:acceptor oxidoreductase family protein [Fervidibacillus albus]